VSGRMFAHANLDAAYGEDDECKFAPEGKANLVTSVSALQPSPHTVLHKPQLDLDIPSSYHYSSTPGHAHLQVDVEVPWSKYLQWLQLSADLGIIQQGWVNASKKRGYTTLRLPHVKKTEAQMKDPYPAPAKVADPNDPFDINFLFQPL
jgi:hypothetical protein